ncbi:hypothetical protein GCM10027290_55340 [Micromonospora sonneratiae]
MVYAVREGAMTLEVRVMHNSSPYWNRERREHVRPELTGHSAPEGEVAPEMEIVPGHGRMRTDDPARAALADRYWSHHVPARRALGTWVFHPHDDRRCQACHESWPCAPRLWAQQVRNERLSRPAAGRPPKPSVVPGQSPQPGTAKHDHFPPPGVPHGAAAARGRVSQAAAGSGKPAPPNVTGEAGSDTRLPGDPPN